MGSTTFCPTSQYGIIRVPFTGVKIGIIYGIIKSPAKARKTKCL